MKAGASHNLTAGNVYDFGIFKVIKRCASEAGCALILLDDGMFTRKPEFVTALARKHRVPAMYTNFGYVRNDGGLISYGINLSRNVHAIHRLHGPDTKGRAPRRPASSNAHRVPARHQQQNGRGDRVICAVNPPRPRRRGDRIRRRDLFAALASAFVGGGPRNARAADRVVGLLAGLPQSNNTVVQRLAAFREGSLGSDGLRAETSGLSTALNRTMVGLVRAPLTWRTAAAT